MNKKSLSWTLLGLMVVASIIYSMESADALGESAVMEGTFFLVSGVAYVPVGVWMLKKHAAPYWIAIVGSAGLIMLYAITRITLAGTIGMEAEGIGAFGVKSKVLQVGIITGSVIML